MEADTPSSAGSFWDFLQESQYRFYQERDLGLDLYHSGWPGICLAMLTTASLVIFLLAIFRIIEKRRHVILLLLGVGSVAALLGLGTTYVHFLRLEELQTGLVRETAGPLPATVGQLAAVICLPLVLGLLTCAADMLGCLYMGLFWGGSFLFRSRREPK